MMSEDKTKVEIADGNAEEAVPEEPVKPEEAAPEAGQAPEPDETAKTAPEDDSKADGEEAKTETDPAPEAEKDAAKEAKAESDRYMRLMAEFQNYKKRVAKEKSDIHAYANENLMTGLLEVLDNFERALASDPAADAEGYAKGMELILTKMLEVLGKAGLEEVKALGEDFDPTRHNAVMAEDSEEYESGKVSKVLQKGYTLNGKVIRPSMVAVAN